VSVRKLVLILISVGIVLLVAVLTPLFYYSYQVSADEQLISQIAGCRALGGEGDKTEQIRQELEKLRSRTDESHNEARAMLRALYGC
jgi:hypothetical protein